MPPLSTELLAELVGGVVIAALIVYAVLGGADFGAGIWDLLARGPRAAAQRRAIAAAMGPVWEANHVWLIFVIVLLFTAFPVAFAALSIAFFVPFHLVLLGVVLRGAGFVFRGHGRAAADTRIDWGRLFGIASVVTPFLLGATLGATSAGGVRAPGGLVQPDATRAWVDPFAFATGALALALCAYLAAVYLTLETTGDLREDFRRRALITWSVTGVLAVGTLVLASTEAPRLWQRLTGLPASPVVIAGILLAPASATAMWQRRFALARVYAVGQVTLLLIGWALAQWPYMIYPDITLADAAAPAATLGLLLWTIPFGLGLLLPSLWLLFSVFKGRNPSE